MCLTICALLAQYYTGSIGLHDIKNNLTSFLSITFI